jgi:hypothetical protein
MYVLLAPLYMPYMYVYVLYIQKADHAKKTKTKRQNQKTFYKQIAAGKTAKVEKKEEGYYGSMPRFIHALCGRRGEGHI